MSADYSRSADVCGQRVLLSRLAKLTSVDKITRARVCVRACSVTSLAAGCDDVSVGRGRCALQNVQELVRDAPSVVRDQRECYDDPPTHNKPSSTTKSVSGYLETRFQ